MKYECAGEYRCRDCGERFPLMLPVVVDVAVGGVTAPRFQVHGPGCQGQVFERVLAPGVTAGSE